MQTPLGNLLRRFADMVDSGECGITAEEFAKVAEQHMKDHERINLLSKAVTLMLDEQNGYKRKSEETKIIDIRNGRKKQ